MPRIRRADSAGDGEDRRIVRAVLPRLEVVAVPPHDVSEPLVPLPEESPVRPILRDPVLSKDVEPAPGLDRVEEDDDVVSAGEPDHRVSSLEVRRIRFREVAGGAERLDPVVGRTVTPAARVRRAEQVDPDRVEARLLPIGQVGPRVLQAQISDQRLGRVADDEERLAALVDEIPPVPGDPEREHERALRRRRIPCLRAARAAGPLGMSTTNRSASSNATRTTVRADRSPPERHVHGRSPYTVSCVVPATKTLPLAMRGTLNFAATSSVSREPA